MIAKDIASEGTMGEGGEVVLKVSIMIFFLKKFIIIVSKSYDKYLSICISVVLQNK